MKTTELDTKIHEILLSCKYSEKGGIADNEAIQAFKQLIREQRAEEAKLGHDRGYEIAKWFKDGVPPGFSVHSWWVAFLEDEALTDSNKEDK